MDATTVYVLVVAFVATLARSTFGFGEGLIGLPLLAFVLPVEVAAPVVVLLSITIAAVVIAQDWRDIHLRSTAWLLGATFAGVPLGVALLTSGDQRVVKAILAVVIMAFSITFLLSTRAPELRNDRRVWLLGCGFVAGVLGGAYGLNGPPLVVYGSLRRWSPRQFRATLQGYFLPASLATVVGYWRAGLCGPATRHYFLMSLWVALPATVLGRMANRRLRGDAFLKYVYGGLAGIGLLLLIQAL